MNPTGRISRRSLLKTSVGAMAPFIGLPLLNSSMYAAEPVVRNGKSHMKLSLAAYSFRDYLTGKLEPKMSLEDFIRYCADLNLDGCELTSYYFPDVKKVSNEYLNRVKQLTFQLGLGISGTAIANDFCLKPGPKRDADLTHTRNWIDYAAAMGAPVIRIFAGKVQAGGDEAEAIDLCAAGINECLDYAATKGVVLALENHGGITATPEQMLKIIAKVKSSPWFGVNLDGGNFHTDDPYRDLAKIAPYAVNAQVKTEVSSNNKKEDADLGRVVGLLRAAHYRGYVVLEYEAKEDPRTAVPKHIARLRELIRT